MVSMTSGNPVNTNVGGISCWTKKPAIDLLKTMARIMVAIALGCLLGITSPYYLFLNWASVIPWGIFGFGLGCYCRTKQESAFAGFLYGFALGFVFLIAGYAGRASLLSRLAPFALLALFSAVCGVIAAFVGFIARKRLISRRATSG